MGVACHVHRRLYVYLLCIRKTCSAAGSQIISLLCICNSADSAWRNSSRHRKDTASLTHRHNCTYSYSSLYYNINERRVFAFSTLTRGNGILKKKKPWKNKTKMRARAGRFKIKKCSSYDGAFPSLEMQDKRRKRMEICRNHHATDDIIYVWIYKKYEENIARLKFVYIKCIN